MSLKVATWGVASILLVVSGCGPTPITGNNTSPTQPVEKAEVRATSVVPTTAPIQPIAAASTPAQALPAATAAPVPAPAVQTMPIPIPKGPPYIYHTVEAGETLSYIASVYDTTIEQLVVMNKLGDENALIQVDQSLRVPVSIDNTSPTGTFLPDSEVVYGPGYVDFNTAEFVTSQGGYLTRYTEWVDGQELTGIEIVERVAERFSVGPRLMLALLEYYGDWVTNPNPPAEAVKQPLGPRNPRGPSLYLGLAFTANRVNAGYYGYKRDGFWIFRLADGSRAITPQGLNAGSVGVQNILAIHSGRDDWSQALGPDGLLAVYRRLFGDPAKYAVEPIVPIDLTQPPLALPWSPGKGFYLTGGPHPAYADGSGWAAIDFGPPDVMGNCFFSSEPTTAAASGVVVAARQGEVQLDLDGDGKIQTGWVLYYLHVALDSERPVQVGQRVNQGDIIGYASCEGGLAESSHLHLARRYNGEWIEAGGPVPLDLAGWVVQPNLAPYDGILKKGEEVRESCECWEADMNLVVNTTD